ncbi:MAG: hypothetical protein CM15mP119_2150 [Alphaproteobacteria bacterium]|nr:MAG: hypothetical protein CM15mP119_2150 [Alphaproteobacteria bacterium]
MVARAPKKRKICPERQLQNHLPYHFKRTGPAGAAKVVLNLGKGYQQKTLLLAVSPNLNSPPQLSQSPGKKRVKFRGNVIFHKSITIRDVKVMSILSKKFGLFVGNLPVFSLSKKPFPFPEKQKTICIFCSLEKTNAAVEQGARLLQSGGCKELITKPFKLLNLFVYAAYWF